MENALRMEVLIGTSPIHDSFSIAMFDYWKVSHMNLPTCQASCHAKVRTSWPVAPAALVVVPASPVAEHQPQYPATQRENPWNMRKAKGENVISSSSIILTV